MKNNPQQPVLRRYFSISLRLLLPLLVVVGLRLSPRPLALDHALSAANIAHERQWHAIEATALQRIAAYQPWRAGLWERIGVAALAAGELEAALAAFQQAEVRADLSLSGFIAYGETFWQLGHEEAALKTWMPLLERGQADMGLYRRAADHWRAAANRDALEQVLRLWVSAFPTVAQPAYELGILLLPESPEAARQYLALAGSSDARLKGRTYVLEQTLAKAESEINPAYGQVLLGRTLAGIGEWTAAERTFALAVQIAPDYAEAWAFLAEARQQTGGDGLAALEAALAADQHSIAARTLAALYWRRIGEPETGLVLLQALADEHPEQGMWQVEMANTLAEMGKYDDAIVHLQRAVAIEPNNAEFWRILGRFCVDNYLGVRETALPAARQALTLAPANPDMLDLMGLVLLQLEDETGAERFLQRALEINPTHAGAHLHLGQLYLNQAKLPQASAHLRQARDNAGESQAAVGIIAVRLLEQYGFHGQ
jgi:tetratricopeptide (TPR) repeat protein